MQHLQSATSLGENIQGLIKDLLMTFKYVYKNYFSNVV